MFLKMTYPYHDSHRCLNRFHRDSDWDLQHRVETPTAISRLSEKTMFERTSSQKNNKTTKMCLLWLNKRTVRRQWIMGVHHSQTVIHIPFDIEARLVEKTYLLPSTWKWLLFKNMCFGHGNRGNGFSCFHAKSIGFHSNIFLTASFSALTICLV